MAKETVLSDGRYAKLLRDIRVILEKANDQANQTVRNILIQAYWNIGKRIVHEGIITRAGYGDRVLADLSEELDVDVRTIQRCVVFFNTYKTAPRSRNLSWSHYKEFLRIKDVQKRKFYENLAVEQGLSRNRLVDLIKEDLWEKERNKEGGERDTPVKLKRPTEATFVYKAIVEKVVDGDTLVLRIDLGFQTWRSQRVRLAGIDTPAMDEPGGREAFDYVQRQLAQTEFVMVKTNMIDMYGRYVGHIFYSLKSLSKDQVFSTGRYLNQELLDQSLAQLF